MTKEKPCGHVVGSVDAGHIPAAALKGNSFSDLSPSAFLLNTNVLGSRKCKYRSSATIK